MNTLLILAALILLLSFLDWAGIMLGSIWLVFGLVAVAGLVGYSDMLRDKT